MISILKNSARTKEPMYVAYNKATTEYTLCKTKEDMAKMEEGFVKAAIDVKAKADADAKAAADEWERQYRSDGHAPDCQREEALK